jgi:hypothetical protein
MAAVHCHNFCPVAFGEPTKAVLPLKLMYGTTPVAIRAALLRDFPRGTPFADIKAAMTSQGFTCEDGHNAVMTCMKSSGSPHYIGWYLHFTSHQKGGFGEVRVVRAHVPHSASAKAS